MSKSAELDLKTAFSLVNEVSQQIEPLKDALAQQGATWEASAWEGLKSQFALAGESRALIDNCRQAISLASIAKSSDQNVSIVVASEGTQITLMPESVKATAHLAIGILDLISKRLKEAQASFQESLKLFPTADAQLRLAFAIVLQGLRDDAKKQFQKVIDDYPESDEAVEANKVLMELERIKLKKWKTALLLSIFLGFCGVDRFYLGYIKEGCIKFVTVGGFYIWWLIDIFRIAGNTLPDANGMKLQK